MAWQKFSRGKKSRKDVAAYHKALRQNLYYLHILLTSSRYRHQAYQEFTVRDPKQRQIHKATVADRIVHQAVVSAIEPIFERRFIYDSYSCRIGKGTHLGIGRTYTFLRQASRNNTRTVYVLKGDIRKYFASIDHHVLMSIIAWPITDEAVLELIRSIIMSHGAAYGKGIPLGNVTSQLFSNIYLHEFDWFMKQTLGVRYYGRYCDDFVIVSSERLYLEGLIEPMRQFLQLALQLELHPNKVTIRSWDQGIDFLGYVLRPHSITLRTKTQHRMIARVNQRNISSYLGLCGHTDAYHLSQIVKLIVWQRDEV